MKKLTTSCLLLYVSLGIFLNYPSALQASPIQETEGSSQSKGLKKARLTQSLSSQSNSQAEDAEDIEQRFQTFEDYHKSHSRTEVVPELSQWEEKDYKLLLLKVAGDKQAIERMQNLHTLYEQEVRNGTLSYLINALIYYGYSIAISAHLVNLDTGDEKEVYDSTKILEGLSRIIEIIKDKKFSYDPNSVKSSSEFRENRFIRTTYQLVELDQSGLTSFPFVSKDGNASFRSLNHMFALKAPIMGLPWQRSCYDGDMNTTPEDFFQHDVGHGVLGNVRSENCMAAYDFYDVLDSLVMLEPEGERAFLDLALFYAGHEKGFYSSKRHSSSKSAVTRENLEDTCNSVKNDLIDDVLKLSTGVSRDESWFLISYIIGEENKEAFYGRPILSDDYISITNPGRITSVLEYIERKKLPKDRLILSEDRPKPMALLGDDDENLEQEMKMAISSDRNFINTEGINLSFYNTLFIIADVFKEGGREFKIWKEGQFNTQGIISAFTDLMDNFRDRYKDKL